MSNQSFSYHEFTSRNFGFIKPDEQIILKNACVFICGVGGMGGACLQVLVRVGISHFILADMDEFEVSNMNRQVFATMKTVSTKKVDATRASILEINPEAEVVTYGEEWLSEINKILLCANLVVNGMDDIPATVRLYRAAQAAGVPVIDAYAASLPSVYVTRPNDKTPEERLNYPTQGRPHQDWTKEDVSSAFMLELEYVMALSSSRHYIDLQAGAEVAAGKRKRMSFAPMVITTGNLMAYEALNILLGKKGGTDNRGYFFNPYTCKTERPPPDFFAFFLKRIARIIIKKLQGTV